MYTLHVYITFNKPTLINVTVFTFGSCVCVLPRRELPEGNDSTYLFGR